MLIIQHDGLFWNGEKIADVSNVSQPYKIDDVNEWLRHVDAISETYDDGELEWKTIQICNGHYKYRGYQIKRYNASKWHVFAVSGACTKHMTDTKTLKEAKTYIDDDIYGY